MCRDLNRDEITFEVDLKWMGLGKTFLKWLKTYLLQKRITEDARLKIYLYVYVPHNLQLKMERFLREIRRLT